MDENNVNNIENTLDYAEPGIKGFKEGNPGRPKGSQNKFSISRIEEAIEEEYEASDKDEKKRIDVFRQFVRMAYIEPSVMIALMKKFVPDRSSQEISGIDEINFNITHQHGDNNK